MNEICKILKHYQQSQATVGLDGDKLNSIIFEDGGDYTLVLLDAEGKETNKIEGFFNLISATDEVTKTSPNTKFHDFCALGSC